MSQYKSPPTIFCDLDGIICSNPNRDIFEQLKEPLEILPGVREKLKQWDRMGVRFYITTGRSQSALKRTIEQLEEAQISYHGILCGFGGGPRVLINDSKPDGRRTAFAYSIPENVGLGGIEIENILQDNPAQAPPGSKAIGGL